MSAEEEQLAVGKLVCRHIGRHLPPVEANIERPDTLSQTLLAAHDNCPRAAYLSRKYKGGPGSIEMDRGIALHEALERCQNLMIETEEHTIPPEVARDLAEAVMAERTDLVLPAREQDRVRGMAWNWAESPHGTIDLKTILGIERAMSIELGGFKCTCRIDRVEGSGQTLYVYDWKSGFPGSRESAEESFQGRFYAMTLLFGVGETGLNLGAGVDHVQFYEVFPRIRNEETGELAVLPALWSREQIYEFKLAVERNVEVFAKSLKTGEWPARDGSWCSRCPAPTECPIPAHLREIEQITSLADAEAVFSRKLALERESRRLQGGLRGWVQDNGLVCVGDYAFDALSSESREVVDWDKLEHALYQSMELGMPFKRDDHIRLKQSTRYAKRKLREDERDATTGN